MNPIARNAMNKTLYKYLSAENALKTLETLKIKITKPKELNDPYEIVPSLSNVSEKLKKILIDLTSEMKKRTAIYCLSGNELNNLMWAHYANNYSGICIGFNSKLLEKINLYEVIYDVSRPTIDEKIIQNRIRDEAMKYILKLMLTKSYKWKDEKEFRFLFDLDEEEITRTIILEKINIICINEIIIGPRISIDDLKELKSILEKPIFSHIEVYGLEFFDNTSYELKKYQILLNDLINYKNKLDI